MTSLPVSFETDWNGVRLTWEGLMAQLSILPCFLVFTLFSRKRRRRLIEAFVSSKNRLARGLPLFQGWPTMIEAPPSHEARNFLGDVTS